MGAGGGLRATRSRLDSRSFFPRSLQNPLLRRPISHPRPSLSRTPPTSTTTAKRDLQDRPSSSQQLRRRRLLPLKFFLQERSSFAGHDSPRLESGSLAAATSSSQSPRAARRPLTRTPRPISPPQQLNRTHQHRRRTQRCDGINSLRRVRSRVDSAGGSGVRGYGDSCGSADTAGREEEDVRRRGLAESGWHGNESGRVGRTGTSRHERRRRAWMPSRGGSATPRQIGRAHV